MNHSFFPAVPDLGLRQSLLRALALGCVTIALLVAGVGSTTLLAAPILDSRAQCGAAVVPDANVFYFNDSKAFRGSGFYRALQTRSGQMTPEAAEARKSAASKNEKLRPLLDLLKKDLSLVVGTCALRQFDAAGRPEAKKTPFVVAFAFDRALTVADVTAAIDKSGGTKPPAVSEHAGYPVLTDPSPKDGPTMAIALAATGDNATTVFLGPVESIHAALDRLRSGQVASITDLPARAAASIEPGAQSWLYIAPPAEAVANLAKLGNSSAGNGTGNTAVTSALNALAGLNALGLSGSCEETLKLRLQGGFASVADAEAVRKFLENVAIPAAKIGAANKFENLPGAVERLRSETSGTSVSLGTLLDAADIGLIPPEALGFFGY